MLPHLLRALNMEVMRMSDTYTWHASIIQSRRSRSPHSSAQTTHYHQLSALSPCEPAAHTCNSCSPQAPQVSPDVAQPNPPPP